MTGNYTFKSPYHKNKRLPFLILKVDSGKARCETVKYRGFKKEWITGDWDIKNIREMIDTGFLEKEGK